MTDDQLKEKQIKYYIFNNPDSDLARAYDLGKKDKALELAPQIERLLDGHPAKNGPKLPL